MLKYIFLPRLVATYLRDFSVNRAGGPSILFKFVYSLCMPFMSLDFRRARLIALALTEIEDCKDQALRLLEKITGATATSVFSEEEYYVPFNGLADSPDFPYDNSGLADNPLMPYSSGALTEQLVITLNGASRSTVESYLQLLIPFYVDLNITYQ